jgi:hypothetical protein
MLADGISCTALVRTNAPTSTIGGTVADVNVGIEDTSNPMTRPIHQAAPLSITRALGAGSEDERIQEIVRVLRLIRMESQQSKSKKKPFSNELFFLRLAKKHGLLPPGEPTALEKLEESSRRPQVSLSTDDATLRKAKTALANFLRRYNDEPTLNLRVSIEVIGSEYCLRFESVKT